VDSLKNKIKSLGRWVKTSWLSFGFFKKVAIGQNNIDRKLVYDLSAHKIPSGRQIKHIRRFLNPREFLIVKICLLVVLVNAIYLGAVFISKHLQYTPTAGGEYVEGAVGYPKTINPLYAINRDIDSDLSRLIYSSLFKYDQNGQLVKDLTEDLTVSSDSKEYIIKIKNNVKWHNGGVLTVDDILFTFSLIQDPGYHSPLRPALASVSAEKVDDLTIKFSLADPYAPFLELLTFGILPKNLWENVSPNSAILTDLNLKPIGSGPFKFKLLVKNTDGDLKDYYLAVNPDYYGQIPYLKSLDFKFFADYPEAIKALNDNQIMGLSYLPADYRQELLARDSLSFHELIQPQIISLFFNTTKNKALEDRNIRLALATSLDKDQIIKDIFAGAYQRADSPIMVESFAYNEAITKYAFSPAGAVETFKNKPLSLTLTVVDSGSNVAVAEQIKSYWEKVGVKMTLKTVASETAADIIKNRDFEVILYGEAIGGDPDVYAFWHSSQIGSKGLNLSGYNNPAVDKLLLEGRATVNQAERIAKYKKFQEIVANDLPVIFLYSPSYTYVQEKSLNGFSGTMIIEPADRFDSVSNWYLKTSKKLTW
jgi:peptide/nickel transport system substrate-binding protein